MADLNSTPRANRIHIGFFGKTNAGKSTLVNCITGQNLSLVSDIKGTTTDPVYKSMELLPLGAVVIIDTPGLCDDTALGDKRIEKTNEVVNKTDIAVMVVSSLDENTQQEQKYIDIFKEKNTPVILAVNIFEGEKHDFPGFKGIKKVFVNGKSGEGVNELKTAITSALKADTEPSLTQGLVKKGDVVVLVMPQDIQAPKGRLILPQVQIMRDLLDNDCKVFCVKTDDIENICSDLSNKPNLVITDSQIFKTVYEKVPHDIPLTSFSVLMSRAKGDINALANGAQAVENLQDGDRVLILEACTHHALKGDIAREKIPNMLKKYTGKNIVFEVASGHEMPKNIGEYALAVHCGGCMINSKNMLSRMEACKNAGVPITNFGTLIAYVNGILSKIVY